MSAAARLLERLEGVRRSGDGWTARCPAHEDRHASLSVGEGAEGRALVHCHAGCATEEIVRRVGLELADLFPDDGGRREPRPGGGRGAAAGAARLPSEAEVSTWAARLLDNEKQLDVFLSRRAWTREAFELLGAGVADGRMTLPMRDAEARIVNLGRYAPKRAPGERKLYVVRGAPRVLFPAPESVDEGDGPLFLLEGEPDVLTGTSVGLACVGVPGVQCWQDAWAERLAGRRVVVCFDCDEPGRRGAARVARSLAGFAADVRVLDLDPDRGDGFDLSDYVLDLLGEDRSGEALAAARDRLLELAGQTEPPRCESAAELLERVRGFVRRFVVLSPAQADGIALWALHTWAIDAADATPYLSVTSPEKQSGKTRLLETLDLLVARPWFTGRVTAAVLARKVNAEQPTLLLDESDAAFKGDKEYAEALRGILNTGYRRGGKASVCVRQGSDFDYLDLSTFSAKAIAGIGSLPDTVADRSIPVRLERRAPDEPVERFRRRRAEAEAELLRDTLAAWAKQHERELRLAAPSLPDELSDRAQDVWEPLLAIADFAAAGWPERARNAALELSAGTVSDLDSVGTRLLADVRAVFDERGADKLSSADLCAGLAAIEEAPWAGWHRGSGLNANTLARLLGAYRVKPKPVRIGDKTPRGYTREQLEEPWKRYLPRSTPPPDRNTRNIDSTMRVWDESEGATEPAVLHPEIAGFPLNQADGAAVALPSGGNGQEGPAQ